MIDFNYNGVVRQILGLNEMEAGAVYRGTCRNAEYALWNGVRFLHLRTKFGDTFMESIEHAERDTPYDVFLPFEMMEDDNNEIAQLRTAIDGMSDKMRKYYE